MKDPKWFKIVVKTVPEPSKGPWNCKTIFEEGSSGDLTVIGCKHCLIRFNDLAV